MKVLLIDQIAKVNYKYTFPLANGLASHGVEVRIAIDQKQEDENCQCVKLRLFNTDEKNIGKFRKLMNYVSSYIAINRLLKKEKFDIIHTEWFTFSPIDYFFLAMIVRWRKVRYVCTVHDILPFNEKFYDRYFHQKLYALANSIILQAPGNLKRFAELFPEQKDKTQMIPHGHMIDYVETCSAKEGRDKLGIPSDKLTMLFFGQIKKVKGVDLLLKAFARVKDEYPELYLVVAGSVWKTDFAECQEIIDTNDFANSFRADIRYIPDEEVKYYYAASDLCVLPYTDVYQSGVIQLAYGYKKAVLASKLPAFTQFVEEDKTGFLFETNDVDSLVKAIRKVVENRERLEQMGNDGYDLVKTQLDWSDIAESIIEKCYRI